MGKPAAVYPSVTRAASVAGQPFNLGGQAEVLLGDGVGRPGVKADPDTVVVVLDVGVMVEAFRRLHDALEERDSLGEPGELEPLVDLASLALPAGQRDQAGVDLGVGQRIGLRRQVTSNLLLFCPALKTLSMLPALSVPREYKM